MWQSCVLQFVPSREYAKEDSRDPDLQWAVQHRCYLSEVFMLLSSNGYEKVAEQYAVISG